MEKIGSLRAIAEALLITILFYALAPRVGNAQQLSVRAVPERNNVYVGQPLLLEIIVEGSDSPEAPDLSHLKSFEVIERGGRQNSRSAVTIINGKVIRDDNKGYVFAYELVASEPGLHAVPAIAVRAEGRQVFTQELEIDVQIPQATDEFKLNLTFDPSEAYVGQAVVLKVAWHIGRSVESFNLNLPLMKDRRFLVGDSLSEQGQGHEQVEVVVSGRKTVAQKYRTVLGAKEYLSIGFEYAVIPLQPGDFILTPATVAGRAIVGHAPAPRSLDPFDRFFDDDFFFGRRRQPIQENFAAQSNSPVLRVKPLPKEGRPSDFSGLVGQYSIIANASPTEVYIGEPITLTVEVAGPAYLANVELPDLSLLDGFANNFKVPNERAAGLEKGSVKVFSQTVRPLAEDISEIPSISLAFFDPVEKLYSSAASAPIPLKVKSAPFITADEVVEQSQLDLFDGDRIEPQDIAPHYEGTVLFQNTPVTFRELLRLPLALLLLLFGPSLFALLRIYHCRTNFLGRFRYQRRIMREFKKRLRLVQRCNEFGSRQWAESALAALRVYLAARLNLSAQSITAREISDALENHGASDELISSVKRIYLELERCAYGLQSGSAESPRDILGEMISAVERIEREAQG